MKTIRRATQYNTAFYVNLPRIWVDNQGIERREPLIVIIREDGHLEIAKLGRARQ